ncbi:MAG: hypothetical protein IPM92_06590 [Saprospiraceae bacterium]|nr:hypothetical protein [Saprospiraceae bacterium]
MKILYNPLHIISLSIALCLYISCHQKSDSQVWPSWANDMVIYELSPYQYVDSGGLKGITRDLPRIRNLFFNTILLQPIQLRDLASNPFNPSSQFAIQDYNEIDPKLGTSKDLKDLISKAQQLGLKIFLEWNIEETGPHHLWRKLHPLHFRSSEKIVNNRYNLEYVKFNLQHENMTDLHREAFSNFANAFNFDGFMIYGNANPINNLIQILRSGLNDDPLLLSASENIQDGIGDGKNSKLFDLLTTVYDSGKLSTSLREHIQEASQKHWLNPFIDYETNLNKGTDYTLFPNAYKYYIMFAYILPGIPWILNGQEFGLTQAINAFNNNSLLRKYHFNEDLFRSLNLQKKNNPALHQNLGQHNCAIVSHPSDVLAIERTSDSFYCVGIFNFSDTITSFKLTKAYQNAYDLFNKIPVNYPANSELKLGPYQAVMFSNVP